jgi:hypothetical protein
MGDAPMNYYHEVPMEEDYRKAEANGIPKKNVDSRIYQGWSIKRAITEPLRKDPYKQYKAQCEELGISNTTFRSRINRGMTPEEAASTPVSDKPFWEHSKRYKDKVIDDVDIQKAARNGIKYTTLISRLHRGWSKDRAITVPPLSHGQSLKKRGR